MKLRYSFIFSISLLISNNLSAQDSIFVNSIGMEFVFVNPGSFTVGKFQPPYPKLSSNNGYRDIDFKKAEYYAKRDSRNGFNAVIKNPFFIGRYEVTQAQWKKIMGDNPSIFQGEKLNDDADRHPVENISWNDAQLFLQKLNELDKSMTYRLPTEFEWEYAARAGATTDISWDEIRTTAQLGLTTTAEIGRKKPNRWGLYDMLGNVWEWVQDYYNEKQFADPVPLKKGTQHVLKGASFVGDVKNATYMTHAAGPANGWDVGFRVVAEPRRENYRIDIKKDATKTPASSQKIFNGKDLSGWHISRTTHQGTTPDFKVVNGAIVGKQSPYGQGGVLLTNKKYKDFELSLEVKIDSFCNGGIFLRSTESAVCYQIELSEPGGTGSLFGDMLQISTPVNAENKSKVWKPNDWNSFRIRMVGEIPTITLWINGEKMWEVTQPKNDFIAGATEGMIGLQVHWSATFDDASKAFDMTGSWRPDGAHRFRNITIKEIK